MENLGDINVQSIAGATSTATIQMNKPGAGHDRTLPGDTAGLIGRLAEGMRRNEDALSAYQTAADSWDRRAAAQGQLRETLLRYAIGDLKRDDVISQLETLTTIWRGDETEIEALQMLARLYTADNRYRDSFYVMRSALAAHPNSDMTRRIQQEAEDAVRGGSEHVILTDKAVDAEHAPIPMILGAGAVHSHLVRKKNSQQGHTEWNAESQVRRVLQCPAQGKQIRIGMELREALCEVVLQSRSYHQRGENGGGE